MDNYRKDDKLRQLLLGRREFLLAAGGALASMSALALEGCGGGGSHGSAAANLTLSATKGQIVLPPGAGVQITQVMNLFGKSVPYADRTFDFGSAAETPVLTAAYGPQGEAVLFGFLQQGNTQLSAHSTAIVLAAFVLGVGAYLSEVQALYHDEIANAASLNALESAIASAIIARGEGWLTDTDAGLVSALAAVQTELSPTAIVTRGVILDKTGRVSGLQVNADGAGSMTITNYYRRRSYVYVDRVSYKVAGTGASVSSPAPILPQPIQILPIKGVSNTLANLGALFGGQRDFYQPVTTAPIPIPVNPSNAASTTYTATAVGVGVSPGDFGKLTQIQQDGWWEVTVLSLLVDIVAPVIAGVVIPNLNKDINNFVAFAGAGGALKDIINAIAASPDIRAKAQAGKTGEAAWDVLLLIVKTDTLKNVFLQMVGDFIEGTFGVPNAPFGLNGSLLVVGDRAKFLASSGVKLSGFISKINVGLQVFDTLVTGFDIARCNSADVFTLEVTNAIAKLNPDKTTVDDQLLPIPFTASVVNADLDPDTLLNYQWTCACKFGDISDGVKTNTTDGNSFPSNSKVLSYVPNGKSKKGDTETVTVQIYKGPFNKRVAIGTATSNISFNNTPKANTITLNASTLVFTKQYPDERITVIAFYTFSAVPNATQYDLTAKYAMGFLTKADLDKGAPILDTNRGTDLSTFVPYGSTRFYNLGGGLIGYYQYPGGPISSYKYSADNEQFQHDGAVLSVYEPATIKVTLGG